MSTCVFLTCIKSCWGRPSCPCLFFRAKKSILDLRKCVTIFFAQTKTVFTSWTARPSCTARFKLWPVHEISGKTKHSIMAFQTFWKLSVVTVATSFWISIFHFLVYSFNISAILTAVYLPGKLQVTRFPWRIINSSSTKWVVGDI